MNSFKQEKKKYKKQDDEKEYTQVPPSDLQAEQAVLGAILLDPLAYEKIGDLITENSFYWKKHRLIFKAISDLAAADEPTDLVSVSTRLTANEKLSEIGGDYYLTELTELVSFPRNVDYYATIVKQKYILREVLNIGEDLGKNCYDPSTESGGLIDWGIAELIKLQKSDERSGFKKIDTIASETVENIQLLSEREGAYTGVRSGFKDLDDKTGGFQKSDLIILAARPSMGKTSLALGFAYNAALYSKVPVGIISLEMSSKQIAMRMMSFVSGIPLYQIRDARIPDEDWTRIPEATGKLSDLPICIDDTATQSIAEVRARARQLSYKDDIGLLVLDYLQLMQPPPGVESQQQAIANISRQLKGLAKELDIPIIALSQLSRAVENRGGSKRPILSDLRDSGAIEQDADVVMFVYRKAYYDKLENKESDEQVELDNTAEIIIGKQRNGPTGVVKLVFLEERAQFVNLETQQAGEHF